MNINLLMNKYELRIKQLIHKLNFANSQVNQLYKDKILALSML